MFSKINQSFIKKIAAFAVLYSLLLTNAFTMKTMAGDYTAKNPLLVKFTTDLSQLASENRLRLNNNFESEVNRLMQTLSNDALRQPVILDEKGENQELIVEQLAVRIAQNDAPANLRGKRLLKLETATLYSNAKSDAEVSQTIENIFAEAVKSKSENIIFVNELINFIGNKQINNALTNAIVQGKIRIIGGSSQIAYTEEIEKISEVAALFAPIHVGMNHKNSETAELKKSADSEAFRGDNVSSDLREMMANDPTGKKRVDVILQAKDAENPSLRAIMAENGVRLQDRIGDTDTLVVSLPLGAVEALAQSGLVNHLSPDRQTLKLGHVENTIGATLTRAQAALGTRPAYTLDGTGIGIAIVDSGVMAGHKAFKNNGGTSRLLYSQNFVTTEANADDNYGHGTHVAGVAAGNSNTSGGRGVAPNANIINLKVLDGLGRGQTSWLLNALEWLKLNHQTYNIRVVNLSLGGVAIDTYTNDPVCRKVQELNALGILVVAAAGNEGKNAAGQKLYGHIHSPGNDPSVLTVGAVNTKDTDARTDDVMATFSSNGPTRSFYTTANGTRVYDHAIKPDLVAPGNKIVAARAKSTSYLVVNYPNLIGGLTNLLDPNDNMISMSGTSMSTPVTAGAAALLFQINPNLTPQMVKMILEYTAQPLSGYNMLEQGAGQLNLEGAVRLAKAYRTDINFNTSATSGMSLLPTGAVFPAQTSTVNGQTFSWSQGIITNHAYLKGQSIADKFHTVYKNGKWFEQGITHNATHNYVLNSNFASITNIVLTPKVTTSNGSTLGDGTFFTGFGVLVSDGVLISDGVLVSDGVLISDGVLVSDGVLFDQ